MKTRTVLVLVLVVCLCGTSSLVGFFSGLVFGDMVLSRPVVQINQPQQPQQCTCVRCLPNHWCAVCGHMSYDCPKLKRVKSGGGSATNSVPSSVKSQPNTKRQ